MGVMVMIASAAAGLAAQAATPTIDIRCEMRAEVRPLTALDTSTGRRRTWRPREAIAMVDGYSRHGWGFEDGESVLERVFYLSVWPEEESGVIEFDETFGWMAGDYRFSKPARLYPDKIELELRVGSEPLVIDRTNGRMRMSIDEDDIREGPTPEGTAVRIEVTGRCREFRPDDRLF